MAAVPVLEISAEQTEKALAMLEGDINQRIRFEMHLAMGKPDALEVERRREFRRMPEVSDEDCRAAALEWLNAWRAEYNVPQFEELPKGRVGNAQDCVLAQGFAGISDGSAPMKGGCGRNAAPGQTPGAHFSREGKRVDRPITPVVNEFINRFDEGRYPDLVSAPAVPGVYAIMVE